MTISEAAEQVLFGKNLEEKLTVFSVDLKDIARPKPFNTPSSPARESAFQLSESGVRASFPGVNVLDQDQPRGELLHFLANHELLASELMALVLLKFPEAPIEYRRGVYEAMREEQMHTLMYMRRMKECGVEFGQLPLNSYFWRLVSPMKSPMEFVTKLNLTFEQANLDFSSHYAQKFREVGDTGTAAVLEKIYQDEIGHVGHGVKWLREWKSPHETDWDAYRKGLELPFSASKAKGLAPFNPEGRRAAGLNEDFISKLSVYSQSRGRNPALHWFNPNAESYAQGEKSGISFQPTEKVKKIEADLELLMVGITKKDDMLLLREKPTTAHLETLREAGIELPELLTINDPTLSQRKLGGLIPWAWSPDASERLAPHKNQLPSSVPCQWRAPLSSHHFSKELGITLSEKLNLSCDTQLFHLKTAPSITDRKITAEHISHITQFLETQTTPQRLKMPFGCSGRGHFTYHPETTKKSELETFLIRAMKLHGEIVIEPELTRLCDFSIHYDLDPKKKEASFKGICLMENTPNGQFLSSTVSAKWTSLIPSTYTSFLFKETSFKELYHQQIPLALSELLPGYHGSVGIDAFLYKSSDGDLKLRPIVEVNVRHTMGRISLELLRKLNQKKGSLKILPKSQPAPENSFPINDPATAHTLQAYWIA